MKHRIKRSLAVDFTMSRSKPIRLLTAFTLLVLAVPVLLAQPALAQDADLYVDAAAVENGDGSREHPFWRITDAIAGARAIRGGSSAKIVIHVAPGTYVGSFTNPGPRIEPLPIRLDVSGLELLGSTSMETDEAGWPTGVIEPGTNTLLRFDPPLVGPPEILVVGNAEVVLEHVTIAKLSLDIRNGGLIRVDRAQDFNIRDNYIARGGGPAGAGGPRTNRSSGQILGNYITRVGLGIGIGPGNSSSPATVLVSGNRSVDNQEGGILLSGSPPNLPLPGDSLSAVVCGNDFSDSRTSPGSAAPNIGFGLRVFVINAGSDQTSGSVTATICNNRIRNNNYGVMIDAGFAYRAHNFIPDDRLYTGTLHLNFEDNEIVGNIRTPALISFTRFSSALNPDQLTGEDCGGGGQVSCFKYLQSSIFDITHAKGELDGYWFDHPEDEPIDGRRLGNIVRINGAQIPNGRFIPVRCDFTSCTDLPPDNR